MAQVTFSEEVGGNGTTVSDDANPNTGLDGGGHRVRFVPALAQVVAVANFVVSKVNQAIASAAAAANSAASALGAPGTNATSTTSIAIGTGAKTITIQTGKLYSVGQTIVVASTASPVNQMAGVITAFNSETGALTFNATYSNGNGTFASWSVALAAISALGGVQNTRQIATSGLATGGGDLSADRTISVPKAAASDLRGFANDTKALTSKTVKDANVSVAFADAATIALDLATGFNFHGTLAGNRTLGAPADLANHVGKSGRIRIQQDATGSRALAYASVWKFAGGAPTLSTAANAVDAIAYFIHDANIIEATFIKDIK